MKTLLITRIEPNPAGKDRNQAGGASASQLASEWVDFKTTGSIQGFWDKIMDVRGTQDS